MELQRCACYVDSRYIKHAYLVINPIDKETQLIFLIDCLGWRTGNGAPFLIILVVQSNFARVN